MKRAILEIENISKRFQIAHELQPYLNIRDRVVQMLSGKKSSISEEFWALKDVSFNVEAGESIGIIGRNGAGKSTLLKILSKITPPSSGKIISRGRIASLLEVGTGFHPELTGRENVLLNGSILGMKRKEILAKFDEIVDFSGIEKFLDTPLKHYSSGMQLRLAFAVAAFLEPEILIIDEVLAVGDAEFQKKCMGKMGEVSRSGRTILFVSHNMNAVNSLCTSCIHLKKGQVVSIGPTEEIINQYLKGDNDLTNQRDFTKFDKPIGDDSAVLMNARLVNSDLETIDFSAIDERSGIEFSFELKLAGMNPVPNIHLYTNKGEFAFVSNVDPLGRYSLPGKYKAVMWIPPNLLNAGTYSAGLALSTLNPTKVHFYEQDAIIFEVIEDVNKRATEYKQPIPGVFRPLLEWKLDNA
ncbi:ABC transporter ATP-binding protein [soil metagenome]